MVFAYPVVPLSLSARLTDQFQILTAAISGAFENLVFTDFPAGHGFRPVYSSTGVTLQSLVVPTGFLVFRGVLVSGQLSDLLDNDDRRMVLRPGVVLNQAERPIQIILNGTSPLAAPSALSVIVEAHCNIANISQRVEAFNWTANSYTQLDQRNMPTSDLRLELTVPNPAEHIRTGDRAVRARVSYKEGGPIFSYPWFARIDQAVWRVVP